MADDLRTRLANLLTRAAEQLRVARLPNEFAIKMESLAVRVFHPCTIAVVGRMKAGKSTFINALLKEDVAVVASSEATATINYIRYGTSTSDQPVRCHWRSGQVTQESRSFMDGLQGNDTETLRLASEIEHLEYVLPNDFLREVVLVDTPGTSTVVNEHQQATAEFLNLRRQLREQHNEATDRLGGEADAVIYLIGEVARATDADFLNEFQEVTGGQSRALNAVGVMSKIDLQGGVLNRRNELASKIATQLQDSLNAVVPVSAGLQRFLDRSHSVNHDLLKNIIAALQQIPTPLLGKKLLESPEFFCELELRDCPIPAADRAALLGQMEWTVFTTVVRTAMEADWALEKTLDKLLEIAGFDQLRQILTEHLFRRGQFLRCYRVVTDAKKLLTDIQYKYQRIARKQDEDLQARYTRFVEFVRHANGNQEIQRELIDFLSLQANASNRAEGIEQLRQNLDRELAEFIQELEGVNDDFQALQMLESHRDRFTDEELHELRALFGRDGSGTTRRDRVISSAEELGARQRHWRLASQTAAGVDQRRIAEQAMTRYGILLHHLARDAT